MSNAKVQKWGNSMALRIPAATMRAWGISEGQSVALKIERGALVARPAQPRYTLDELLAKCTPKNMALTNEDRAWLNAPAVGKEADL